MPIFPPSLAPSFFDIEGLPTYGIKLTENELGKEVRRFTETTGHHTRLSVRYTGMRGTDVATLIGFYHSVKGTFGSFELPQEFYLNPTSYNAALALLEDTTSWRFESAPSIETVQSDIYITDFVLLSLKNEEQLNLNTIFGILSSVNMRMRAGKVLSFANEEEDVLPPLATYDAPEVFLADVEFVEPLELATSLPQVRRTSTAEVLPVELLVTSGNIDQSAEFFLFVPPGFNIDLPRLVVSPVETQDIGPANLESFKEVSVTGVTVPQADVLAASFSFDSDLEVTFTSPDIEVVSTLLLDYSTPENAEVVDPLPEVPSSTAPLSWFAATLGVISPLPKEPVNTAPYSFIPTTSIQALLVEEATPKPLVVSYGFPDDLTPNIVTLVPCEASELILTLPSVNNIGAFVRQIIKPNLGLFPDTDVERNEVDFERVITGEVVYGTLTTVDTRIIDSQGSITPEMLYSPLPSLGEAVVQSRNEQGLTLVTSLPNLEEGVIVYEDLIKSELSYVPEPSAELDFPDVQPVSDIARLEYTSYGTDRIETEITSIVRMSIVPSQDFRGIEEGIRSVDAPSLSLSREYLGFVFTTDGFGLNFEKRNSDFNAYGNAIFSVNTSAGEVTATLSPVASDDGKLFIFADANGTLLSNSPTGFGNNKLRIVLQNSTMAGLNELDLDVDNQGISLVYCHDDSTFTIWGNAN